MAASTEIARGHVTITADDTPVKRALASLKQTFTGAISNITAGIAQGLGQALYGNIGRGISAIISEIPKAIHAASDLSESINKISVAFGDSSKDMLAWSQTSATALGQSQQQALEAASSFGLLFRTMGVGSEESAQMSKALVQLATDMASINNIPIEDALLKLRSGLVGESEPLRSVGVLLNEAAVQAKAMELGLATSTKALTEQDKVMARYQLILEQTALTQGDFARTIDSIANQERILSQQMENFRATLGGAFTPIYAEILRGLNLVVSQVAGYGTDIVKSLATGLVNGVIYLLPFVRFIQDFFKEWFRPSSPPKFLPDIDKWMTETINIWLSGASKADFGILRDLGSSIEGILRSYVGTGQIAAGDIVSRIFGSQAAIARAIVEWKTLGGVTQKTLDEIRRLAGPAGNGIAGLVKQYLAVEDAAEGVERAQRRLNDITEKYNRILSPIRGELDTNQQQQQTIRDRQRIAELQDEIADTETTADERRLAQLEIEEIQLRRREAAVERRQGTEEEAAQAELDRARATEEAAQAELARQQAILDAQVRANALIAEEIRLRQQAVDEARRAAEEAARDTEARLAALERLRQAELAYQLAVATPEGRLGLLQGELARTQQGTPEYFALLLQIRQAEEAIAQERERAAEEQQRIAEQQAEETERLRQAQLAYALAIGGTENDIRLLREELGRYSEGSVEYYQILGQIHGAEEQLRSEQEAAAREREAEQERAQRAAEQAAEDAKRVAEQRSRDLEALYQAALRYNLATTDTEGQLALMRLELGRYTEGSVEYYNILTQIAGLEEQLARERETGGGGPLLGKDDVIPSIDSLDIPQWATDLADRFHREIDKALREQPDFGITLNDLSTYPGGFMGPQPEKVSESTREIRNFIKSLKDLTAALVGVTPSLTGLATMFGALPDASKKSGEDTNRETDTWLQKMTRALNFWKIATTEGWDGVWAHYVAAAKADQRTTAEDQAIWLAGLLSNISAWWTQYNRDTNTWFEQNRGQQQIGYGKWATELGTWLSNTSRALGQWLTDTNAAFSTWLQGVQTTISTWNLSAAGGAMLQSLWTGISTFWTGTVVPGWNKALQWIADLLPGSEPKSTSSPLYGLKQRGSAIINNIWDGIKAAWTGFAEWWQDKMDWISDMIPDIPFLGGYGGQSSGYSAPSLGGYSAPSLATVQGVNIAGVGSTSTTTNTTNAPVNVTLHFSGPVTDQTIRGAVRTASDELRARGIKPR